MRLTTFEQKVEQIFLYHHLKLNNCLTAQHNSCVRMFLGQYFGRTKVITVNKSIFIFVCSRYAVRNHFENYVCLSITTNN